MTITSTVRRKLTFVAAASTDGELCASKAGPRPIRFCRAGTWDSATCHSRRQRQRSRRRGHSAPLALAAVPFHTARTAIRMQRLLTRVAYRMQWLPYCPHRAWVSLPDAMRSQRATRRRRSRRVRGRVMRSIMRSMHSATVAWVAGMTKPVMTLTAIVSTRLMTAEHSARMLTRSLH